MRNIVVLGLACSVGLLAACGSSKKAASPPGATMTGSGSGGGTSATTGGAGAGGNAGAAGKGQGGAGGKGAGAGGKAGAAGKGQAGNGGKGQGGAAGKGQAGKGGAAGNAGVGGAGGMAGNACSVPIENNCNMANAVNETGHSKVTITFGNPLEQYSPPCVLINPTTTVTFSGDLVADPIEPGPDCTKDTCGGQNPINGAASVTFFGVGTFPYHSKTHCGSGMVGVIYSIP